MSPRLDAGAIDCHMGVVAQNVVRREMQAAMVAGGGFRVVARGSLA